MYGEIKHPRESGKPDPILNLDITENVSFLITSPTWPRFERANGTTALSMESIFFYSFLQPSWEGRRNAQDRQWSSCTFVWFQWHYVFRCWFAGPTTEVSNTDTFHLTTVIWREPCFRFDVFTAGGQLPAHAKRTILATKINPWNTSPDLFDIRERYPH